MNNRKNTISKVVWSVISILLAVFTIRAVMNQSKSITLGQLIEYIKESNKLWFIAGSVSALLYVWFEGTAIRTILKDAGYKKKRTEGLIYSTSDVYFSAVTPSATGGQPASAYFMIKDGIPVGITTATLVLNLIMYNASIGILGIIAVIISPKSIMEFGGVARLLICFGILALVSLSLFFLIVLKKGTKLFSALIRFVKFLEKKGLIRHSEKTVKKLNKAREDYAGCSELISGKPGLMGKTFIWNFLQRASQILVPMFIYISTGGDTRNSAMIFSKQCLINIGYNFIPIPGAMGVSDYLMVEGFKDIMGTDTAYKIEMISRGITFYLCVSLCGIITLIGYLVRRKRK